MSKRTIEPFLSPQGRYEHNANWQTKLVMCTPFFSIIIPSYNRAHTIGRAVQSCLAQSYSDYEVIVIDDDRSTDNMREALKPYQSLCRISLIANHQGSAAAARNTGIDLARGNYVAFLDADDLYLPTKLATVAARLAYEPETIFYSQNYIDRGVGRWWIKPQRGLNTDENIFDYLFACKGWMHPSSVVLPTEVARQNHFDPVLSFGDDTQFITGLWLKGINITMIEIPLTLYDDPYTSNRLSQSPAFKTGNSSEHRNFMRWVESQKHVMPRKAYLAYCASFRSRFFARKAPLRALRDIWLAWRYDALTAKQCVDQTVQTFFPGLHRRIADLVVRYRGIKPLKLF